MNPHLLGTFAACLVNDVPPSDYEMVKGAAECMRTMPNAAAFGREIAALAADVFVKAGHAGDFEAHLYDQLSKTAEWHDVHFELLDPVYSALTNFDTAGKSASQNAEVEQIMEKRAAALWAVIKGLGQKIAPILSASPGVLFGAAGVTGAGLGALHWGMNRAATGTDADSAALESKIDYYNSIRREIADELKRNPPPALREAMRKKLQAAEEPGYAL